MVDYTKSTGTSGTMLIRDLGSKIQFWIHTSSSGTWIGSPGTDWNGRVNNTEVAGKLANYSNSEWRLLAEYTVTTAQTVRFSIEYTGTSAFGGPTDFYQAISRGTVPPAPTMLGFSLITHTTSRLQFSSNGNGGSAIIRWQVGWSYETHPTSPQNFTNSSGTTNFTGFTPGRKIYAWARGENAVGFGPWSARADMTFLPGIRARVGGVWVEGVPYVKKSGVWVAAIPYLKKAGVWVEAIR